MTIFCAHVWISGRVQGVGYRYATADQAQQRQIRGWVRNLADGRVEAIFEGTRSQIEPMLAWCDQGPDTAKVLAVEVVWEDPTNRPGFEIRPTV